MLGLHFLVQYHICIFEFKGQNKRTRQKSLIVVNCKSTLIKLKQVTNLFSKYTSFIEILYFVSKRLKQQFELNITCNDFLPKDAYNFKVFFSQINQILNINYLVYSLKNKFTAGRCFGSLCLIRA